MQTHTTLPTPDTAPQPGAHEIQPWLIPATRRVARPDFRAALTAAFRRLGVSVAAATAFDRTKAYFRANGADWTRALS